MSAAAWMLWPVTSPTTSAARSRRWPLPGGGIRPRARSRSAGGQSGHRGRHSSGFAGRCELAVLAHGPGEYLRRVGVDRVQVAAVTGDSFVAEALRAPAGRARYRIAQLEAPVGGDLV